MSDTKIVCIKEIKQVFELMVQNKIESFKAGDIEITRESLKIEQAENDYKIETEKTKQAMTRR